MDLLWACELEHLRAYCDRVLTATPEAEQAAFSFFQNQPEQRQILSVDGETAAIEIRGTLTNRPPAMARFFGFNTTSYSDIQAALETVAADDSIRTVRLVIDSPGGGVTGLDETWIAIRELAKTRKVIAENHGLMASAAYWLASAADRIVATSPAAETGSIGVYLLAIDYSKQDEKYGIKEIRIVSKNAPLKNPDPATKIGLQAYQNRIDALERVFISRVAEGRGITAEKVEKDFGRGGVLVALDPDGSKPSALSVGMIDEVLGAKSSSDGRWRREKGEANPTDVFAGSPPFKDFPVVDKPWDSAAAIKRVREKTGSTEKPSASYKQAFFWNNPEKAEDFGGYKLPFVDVVEGKLSAVRRGVFAAKGAMAGARGQKPDIPAEDISAVNSHIDKYVQKIEKEDKAKGAAAPVTPVTGKVQKMKYSDLQAGDPELFAEIQKLIEAAKAEAAEEFAVKLKAVKAVLTGTESDHIKGLAVKVLEGEATEAELAAARNAYAAATEAAKAEHATRETEGQGSTTGTEDHAVAPNETGEIRTEDDYNSEVARFRKSRGQEAN